MDYLEQVFFCFQLPKTSYSMLRAYLFFAVLYCSFTASAQKNWFTVYTDTVQLLADAKWVTKQFEADIAQNNPKLTMGVATVVNTTPYLIFYDDRNNSANLPNWSEVIAPQKQFFYQVAGSEANGKEVFGLFFNGFYLAHELGHAVQELSSTTKPALSFQNEYFANQVAMLWWRKHNRQAELERCYNYAKKMLTTIPSPVPANTTEEAFFTANYEKASQDPYVYGYMQFRQFIKVYEDKNLPDFDTFVKAYFAGLKK
ncbi:MAG: hypothetical protein EAY72_07880 [Bacteroidetes bacterium]|nr:MAG: hypothetical protein EAY72_07880 [Bacteroidota bacterium]